MISNAGKIDENGNILMNTKTFKGTQNIGIAEIEPIQQLASYGMMEGSS